MRKIHAPTTIIIFFLTSCSSLFMALSCWYDAKIFAECIENKRIRHTAHIGQNGCVPTIVPTFLAVKRGVDVRINLHSKPSKMAKFAKIAFTFINTHLTFLYTHFSMKIGIWRAHERRVSSCSVHPQMHCETRNLRKRTMPLFSLLLIPKVADF